MKNTIQIMPKHIAIIMDGNRRWAEKRGLPSIVGHKKGYLNFKKIAEACDKLGIKILTVYAFSTENWQRSKTEVSYLMKLFEENIKKERKFFNKNNIRFNVIGQIEKLPEKLRKIVCEVMEKTKENKKRIINVAISYGGRAEIINVIKKILERKVPSDKIDEKIFEEYLYTAGQKNPDLIIRTGGEKRLSGFLTWQSVYSELYFSDKLWPDFNERDLKEAIQEFQKRQRRFGR
ncbi:MAG: isoprenyl transferase [Patescibacteria group bacterium]